MGATGPFKLYNLQLKKKLVISCGQRGIEAPTTHTVSEQQQQQHVFLRKSLFWVEIQWFGNQLACGRSCSKSHVDMKFEASHV